MVAVSLLVVVGVCWGRGDEPGGTVTALPPDFTTAAHPAGSGTGTAALRGASGTGAPVLRDDPNAPDGPRTGPPRRPASSVPPARTPGPATDGPRTEGPHPRGAVTSAPGPRRPAPPTPPSPCPAPQPPPPPRSPARRPRRPEAPPPAGLRPLPRSRATRLLIPYLRLDAPVMDLGLDSDRRLTAPPDDDPKLVGWYRHGASPGEQGTAVAVGHLDTDSGPAVFAGLPELKRGRIVKARRADGRIAVYTVDKIKSYEKAHFPSQEVYGARGRPELRLITCGGSYDRRKGYSGNVVVFAHLTGIR
ncbi:class F sortase [Streptomyces sp. FXY-T5]|uniref:class F sortase n=1 Tax=Streptomyces sp. FXY-T5 TaxID=3064901 RepID=UPI0027D32A3C|nr:class F sortase [Streptomyces sp. FXY-T5]WMD07776.1 class F sortase [Streptomyces sp. FXY-T5]